MDTHDGQETLPGLARRFWLVWVGLALYGAILVSWYVGQGPTPANPQVEAIPQETYTPEPWEVREAERKKAILNDPFYQAPVLRTVGQQGYLDAPEQLPVALATTLGGWKALDEAIRAGDKYGIANLMLGGHVFAVEKFTHVLVLDEYANLTRVRILSGSREGKSGWILAVQVKKFR